LSSVTNTRVASIWFRELRGAAVACLITPPHRPACCLGTFLPFGPTTQGFVHSTYWNVMQNNYLSYGFLMASRVGLEVQCGCLSALVVSFSGRSRTPDNTPGGTAMCCHVPTHAETALKQAPPCAQSRGTVTATGRRRGSAARSDCWASYCTRHPPGASAWWWLSSLSDSTRRGVDETAASARPDTPFGTR
jgi:hypothetical protein